MRYLLSAIILICAVCRLVSQSNCSITSDFESPNLIELFGSGPDTVGLINHKEISGIALSIKYPGHFWAIQDSGNGAVLYLYDLKDASLRALFILNGINNVDWEDLTIQVDQNGDGTLYIPDFGDNQAKRKGYTIYKIPELEIREQKSKIHTLSINPDRIRFMYSNGARDAEAFAFDPIDSMGYIFTKREKEIFVYSILPKASNTTQYLETLGNLPITNVVAADFSSDGNKFLLKTYTNIYLWQRLSKQESFCEMISRKPKKVPYQLEPQGESICFTESGFITVSEERFGIKPVLYLYPFKD